jgi:hypothetical protein
MKAFLVGLVFLAAVSLLAAAGVLIFPLFVVMAWVLRAVVVFLLIIAAIWLLGKFIIFAWEKIKDL